MATETVRIRKTESISDEIEQWNDRIRRRAYELFIDGGSVDGHDLENRSAAERELARKQHEHTEDTGIVYICEFVSNSLFRTVHFPKKINPNKVKGEFKNGVLHVKAAIAEQQRARKIGAGAA